MNRKSVKILSLIFAICLIAGVFSSCDSSVKTEDPVEAHVAVDLKDPVFSFTYSELKGVLESDTLGETFADFEELNDDTVINLNYNQISINYGNDEETFNKVMALLSEEEKASLTANSADALQYFIDHIQKTKNKQPTTEYDESFWTDDDTIKFTKDGKDSAKQLGNAVSFYKDIMLRKIDGLLLNGNTATDDPKKDITDILYILGSEEACLLTMDDVISVYSSLTPTYILNSDKEKVPTEYIRTIKIVLKDTRESVEKAFSFKNKSVILEELKKGSDYFTAEDYDIAFNGCTITATFNAVTDNLINVTYDKNMIITSDITGVGSLESLGTQTLTFNCTDRLYYVFGWANEAK